MRNSENTTPVFVSIPPDWSQGASCLQVHSTIVTTTRNGLEQRERGRLHARMRISFQRRGLTLDEWSERIVRIMAEVRSVCIVPFWTDGMNAKRLHSGTLLRTSPGCALRVAPMSRLIVSNQRWIASPVGAYNSAIWQAASYAYVTNGDDAYFADILKIDERQALRLRSANGGAVISSAPFPMRFVLARRAQNGVVLAPPPDDESIWNEARLYPCFECRRISDQDMIRMQSGQSRDEALTFESL